MVIAVVCSSRIVRLVREQYSSTRMSVGEQQGETARVNM
jgi:hypothetical protein